MNANLDMGSSKGGSDDLSALAWVHGELRRSLENAHKALRRYLKESEAIGVSDVDTVDPAVLRTARAQLHQGVGALELVGLPAAARLMRASESAVQRLVNKPSLVNLAAIETIERASFALLDYLARMLAGKPPSAVALFPQYREVLQLAGADRIHPADLWAADWSWHDIAANDDAAPRRADDSARTEMEALILPLMRRADPATLHRMSDLCAELSAGAGHERLATLWQLAASFFEAQALGLLPADLYAKRVASRLLAQLRLSSRGQNEPSERLAQDLLFFCGQAKAPRSPQEAPRLAAVRHAWQLPDTPAADYEVARLGRFDPAWITQARKRVAQAKDAWSAVAGGELHRLAGLSEQVSLLGDSLQRLFPSGEVLAGALQAAAAAAVTAGQAPPAALSMEVATGMLYVDASLEDGELDQPELAARVERLAQRVDDVRAGAEPQPLEPWMEELYRRVSDRQTMGSVVQELRVTLSEVEKQIDQYFRNPAQREVLIPVPGQLSAMRGVLSVLGIDQASQAVLHMRDSVDELANTEVDAQRAIETGTFDHLADNLGALSFLIDMLSVQPQLAKSLFRFDPASGTLSAVMGLAERPSMFASLEPSLPEGALESTSPLYGHAQSLAQDVSSPDVPDAVVAAQLEQFSQKAVTEDQSALARKISSAQQALHQAADEEQRQAVRAEIAQTMAELTPQVVQAPAPPPAPIPPPRPAPPAGDTGLEDDAEMREIFIEEAREVIDNARASMHKLAEQPDDVTELTTIRRAFHTLKGSSRMVGLKDYGDAAWSCEQLYNARLAQPTHMDGALREFTREALDYLAEWTEAIAESRHDGHDPAAVSRAADALRNEGLRVPIVAPAQAAESASTAVPEPASPTPAPLELDLPPLESSPPELSTLPPEDEEPVAEAAGESSALSLGDLVLDLPSESDLDLTPAPAAAPAPQPEDDLAFELDLGDLGETPTELEAATEPAALADQPAASAEVLELDLSDLDAAFADLQPHQPSEATAADLAELDRLVADSAPLPAPHIDLPLLDELQLDDEPASHDEPVQPEPVPEPALALSELADLVLADEPAEQPDAELVPAPEPEPPAESEPAQAEAQPQALEAEEEQVKVIGPLRISIPLFNIYLNEADELSRRLVTELAEWSLEPARPAVSESSVALAHSLAGSSATVGYADLSALARALEHALMRSATAVQRREGEPELFNDAAEEIRRLLHQFAAGFLRPVSHELMERLAAHERWPFDEVAPSDVAAPLVEPEQESPAAAVGVEELPAQGLAELHPPSVAELEPLDEIQPEPLPVAELEPEPEFAPEAELQTPPEPQAEAQAQTATVPDLADALPPTPAPAEPAHALAEPVQGPRLESISLTALAPLSSVAFEPRSAPAAGADAFDDEDDIDAVDAIDDDLFPVFEEEADELLPQLQSRLRDWADKPTDPAAAAACMRTLHTFKGGARLAGAMRLGEMAHRLETAIEHLVSRQPVAAHDVEPLVARVDTMSATFEAMRHGAAAAPAAAPVAAPAPEPVVPAQAPVALAAQPLPAPTPATADTPVDWARFSQGSALSAAPVERVTSSSAAVRVRGPLLDRLVNHAGEVSITRARIDSNVKQLQGSLTDLTESLDRLRRQLRDIELQAESQISSRLEAAKAASQSFDPLEMDRFTRFQELTRMMAESVNDVATLQRGLQRTLQSTEDELASQVRLTRELQDDLLRTRMVEFESIADRLYRVVRQAAKDTGKQVRLDILGGAIEVDRGVLDRMIGPFEHLLRNSVAHGIEPPDAREASGKEHVGNITISARQEGNEVGVEFRDDGNGLDFARIRERAVERGLLSADATPSEAELANLLFTPGFSTAATITELAGRGIGLDVVRAEVNSMGGRIETASSPGQGTSFRLVLPLTTAVTQVVMLRCGEVTIAVPSTLVELVRRVPAAEIEQCYASGAYSFDGQAVPFFWLSALLQAGTRGAGSGKTQPVVIVRSAAQRVALHVDEVFGNQEVVVKNVGPQLSRLPGLAGVTLLPSGAVALIYNPVALAALYGDRARAAAALPVTPALPEVPAAAPVRLAPLVLVVDDSLTVRRVTQRLLLREGYRVTTAKDGLDALERLTEERPTVMLSDIEMPRMDGFDLVRNVRADPALADLPVVMITSRIAQKHRDYAAQLGVDHYLGKPYAEEELLGLVARYAGIVAAT